MPGSPDKCSAAGEDIKQGHIVIVGSYPSDRHCEMEIATFLKMQRWRRTTKMGSCRAEMLLIERQDMHLSSR